MGSWRAGNELIALGRRQAEGVPGFFERQKELGAVGIFPGAGVRGASAQADDDGHMLDADRALEFAGAAGGAFVGRFQRQVRGARFEVRCVAAAEVGEQRGFRLRAEGVEIAARPQNDLLGVEDLAGGGGGTVLGTAATFHAAIGLQRDDLGEVLASSQPEVFHVLVSRERRDGREAVALQEDGDRREDEVQVLGVGDQRQEDEQGERMRPPGEL